MNFPDLNLILQVYYFVNHFIIPVIYEVAIQYLIYIYSFKDNGFNHQVDLYFEQSLLF